jgi:basic amino acid/polyamine antiporter, APA family
MIKKLFIKKTVQSFMKDAAVKRHAFTRSLSALNLVTIGIGAIIGAGLFVITGQVAAEHAGPGILFSFVIAGAIALVAALCYAEFAALIPISGSAYSYAYATIGEFPAWILGWGLTMQYLFSPCAVSVGWSSYFTSLLQDVGIIVPSFLASAPFAYDIEAGWRLTGAFVNLPAIFIMGFMGVVISMGIKAAATFNNIMVILKLSVVALFIFCGIFFVKAKNLTPIFPENVGVFGEFGFSGILRGAGVLFFAFIGFDALSTLTQEAKDPQRDLPRGMVGSISICTLVYLIFAFVLVGLVSYKLLGVADPIAVAVNVLGPKFIWLRFFIKGSILAGLTSVIMVMLLGQVRILYTMAHDGLLPKKMGTIHDKTHVPLFTTILVTVIGMCIAGLFPVGILGQLVSMATLMAFAIVCLGILILHYTQPNLKRPFSTPWKPWIPLIGTFVCFGQMILLPAITWVQFASWLGIGCIVYFTYSMKRSHVRLGK